MCGIFAHVGPKACASLLIEGLRRLEYRGYDSWGIALGVGSRLRLERQVGPISEACMPVGSDARYKPWGGIAHTRWATHGPPSKQNAHPHPDCSGRVAVVHNGIIENHQVLRALLEEKGHTFSSQTDSEVIAHLIEEAMAGGQDFPSAFLSALRVLEGAYGVAAICADSPGIIMVGRMGSPLIIGVAEHDSYAASDPVALVPHTQRVIYLHDGEVAELGPGTVKTYDLNAAPLAKPVEQIALDLPAIERGGYPHFMLKEIFEQPESIRNAFRGRIVRSEGMAKLGGVEQELLRRVRRCHLIGCGTSLHAAMVGQYLLENLARVPAQVSHAAEFRYSSPVLEPHTLVIALSQSGETADTLAAVREAARRGADVMSICNVVGSSIARECGRGIYIHAGPEIGVASTKAFTGQLVALVLLAIYMGRLRDMPLRDALLLLQAIERLPEQAAVVLGCNDLMKEMAQEFCHADNFLYLGRLYEYPVALEGALKLKEISYIHAEGIPAAELKHGPLALVDEKMPVVVVSAQEHILDKTLNNVQEIKARGGRILAVAREGDRELPRLAERTVFIPPVPDPLVPILAVIPLQLLAYHIAVMRGCDVDKPRNLAKSVTVE